MAKQPVTLRIEHPTRLDRARKLGYKAKQGFVVARTKVRRGGLRKLRPRSGRRPKRMGVAKFKPGKSIRLIAEERTAKKFPKHGSSKQLLGRTKMENTSGSKSSLLDPK